MSVIHQTPHPQAGQTVILKNGAKFTIDDWFDRVAGKSWTRVVGNVAANLYAFRSGRAGIPIDDEVVYGAGNIVHISEIAVPHNIRKKHSTEVFVRSLKEAPANTTK